MGSPLSLPYDRYRPGRHTLARFHPKYRTATRSCLTHSPELTSANIMLPLPGSGIDPLASSLCCQLLLLPSPDRRKGFELFAQNWPNHTWPVISLDRDHGS